MDRRQIELNLAPNFEKQLNVEKAQLSINNDTSFDIYYDICLLDNKKYLYIKMIENTANAPFYYNKSYTIEDLYNLHKIFKADNIDEVKEDIKTLFKKDKITLYFAKNESIIIMELDVINFATNYKVNFELYREMIPHKEKDQKLIDLYALQKKNLKYLKELYFFSKNYKAKKEEMAIIEEFKKKILSSEIPGIEEVNEKENNEKNEKEINILKNNIEKEGPINDNKNDNINNIKKNDENINDSDIILERKQSVFKKCKICPNLRNRYLFKIEKGNFNIALNLINISDFDWPLDKTELKCDEENSSLKPSGYDYPKYDIEKTQEGDFLIYFNNNDIKEGKYICKLNLYVNGVKIEDSDIELNIKVR